MWLTKSRGTRLDTAALLTPELISDPDQRAAREASNGLRQIDAVVEMVEHYVETGRPFRLRVSILLHLHRIALEGISAYAGNFRPAGIEIGGSKHQPIGAHLMPGSVEEMCDYVNNHWDSSSALHLAAYTLWRLNWIHPFTDGNGRTARATSYLALCEIALSDLRTQQHSRADCTRQATVLHRA